MMAAFALFDEVIVFENNTAYVKLWKINKYYIATFIF
jgi:hypothetical protein